MSRKSESKQVIILSAVVILLFTGILVSVNLYFLNRMNHTLSTINETQNKKLQIINQMSNIIRDRSLAMLNMYLSDDFWGIDTKYMAFHQMAAEFITLREQLILHLDEEEKAVLQDALKIIQKTEPLQNEIVEQIHIGKLDGVRQAIIHKDMPLESQLWNSFDNLVETVRGNAQLARLKANESFRHSLLFVVGIAFALAVLIIMVMLASLRRIQDIEKRLIDKAESLDWEASHDPLTNIWNRRYLRYKVNELFSTEKITDARHALLFLDLDNFKPINDTYGHHVGDHFLRAIVGAIDACIRKNDTLARVGGDEFAVLLENCNLDKAQEIAECINDRIRQCTIFYDSQQISVDGCSIGIAALDDKLSGFDQLLKQADSACYAAKHHGKNRIVHAVTAGAG